MSIGGHECLTAEQLDLLLRLLGKSAADPAAEYEMLRWKLVRFFQWNCAATAEELADRTFNRVARKLAEGNGEIGQIAGYALGVARMIQREERKRAAKTVALDSAPLSDAGASADALDARLQTQEEIRCLNECLQLLSPQDRWLFVAYRIGNGQDTENRRTIARMLGITPGALRVRVNRLRERVERCLAEKLGSWRTE